MTLHALNSHRYAHLEEKGLGFRALTLDEDTMSRQLTTLRWTRRLTNVLNLAQSERYLFKHLIQLPVYHHLPSIGKQHIFLVSIKRLVFHLRQYYPSKIHTLDGKEGRW